MGKVSKTQGNEGKLKHVVLNLIENRDYRKLGTYYDPEMETSFEGGTVTVLAHNTEGYICLLDRGDKVKVTAYHHMVG